MVAIAVVLALTAAGGAAGASAGAWIVESRQAANADSECDARATSGGNAFIDGWATRNNGRYSCVFRTPAGTLAHGGLVIDRPSPGVARTVVLVAGVAGVACVAIVLFGTIGVARPRSALIPSSGA